MIRVPESKGLWCVQAHDDMMAVAETLTIGDAVAIQGKLQIAARPGPGGRRNHQHYGYRNSVPAIEA
jgi:hypothetical protein